LQRRHRNTRPGTRSSLGCWRLRFASHLICIPAVFFCPVGFPGYVDAARGVSPCATQQPRHRLGQCVSLRKLAGLDECFGKMKKATPHLYRNMGERSEATTVSWWAEPESSRGKPILSTRLKLLNQKPIASCEGIRDFSRFSKQSAGGGEEGRSGFGGAVPCKWEHWPPPAVSEPAAGFGANQLAPDHLHKRDGLDLFTLIQQTP